MGHEAILYGRIIGATGQWGSGFRLFQDRNRAVIHRLPEKDVWPWVVRGMFALPARYPQGVYRQQVIHFGLSIKDDPDDRGIWNVWLGKFESVLRHLYWTSTILHLTTDFEPPRVFEWVPTEVALGRMYGVPPQAIAEWTRSVRFADPRHAESPVAQGTRET